MSISKKLFYGISAFILIFVALSYGGFVLFMPDFVEDYKQAEMKNIADQIRDADNSAEIEMIMGHLSASTDISVVIEEAGIGMYGSESSRGYGQGRNSNGLGNMLRAVKADDDDDDDDVSFFYAEHHVLNTPFMIYKDAADKTYVIYVMRPAQSVDDVVRVAGRFLGIIAAVAILSGLVFSYIYSRRFVNPIIRLNNIAKHMAKLDFSQVYKSSCSDEIGELGNSINYLSSQLNRALSDLEAELKHTEKLNAEQRRFLADASHELKTPLTVVMGNVEQLRDMDAQTIFPEKYIQAIINETEHMSQIIGDLLRISELESEYAILKSEEIDLASIIDDVLFSYTELIRRRGIELDYQVDDSIPIEGDGKHMETVIRNVINNAIVHSDFGAAVKVSSIISDNRKRIEIFNETNPVPEEQLNLVFDRFRKLSGADKPEKGTGLGLSIAKSILEMHGFEFGLSNVEGGLLFYIDISS